MDRIFLKKKKRYHIFAQIYKDLRAGMKIQWLYDDTTMFYTEFCTLKDSIRNEKVVEKTNILLV